MKLKIFFLFFIFTTYTTYSQEFLKDPANSLINIDSLYSFALSLKPEEKVKNSVADIHTSGKCGMQLIFKIKQNWDKFNSFQKKNLSFLFERPLLDKSVLSKNKNFRIHYDTSGSFKPDLIDNNGNNLPDYVDSVAYYLEYCLEIESNILSFGNLAKDGSLGGGGEFDVYIENLPGGEYGSTTPEDIIPSQNNAELYTSYIIIDNNYSNYYSRGIDGLKVTIAHELFHALQVANYGVWWNDFYFYELLSTWMEQKIFPEIKDYYQYLPDYFSQTDVPFWKHEGYDLSIFGIYFELKYQSTIFNKMLENIKKYNPISAIDNALRAQNSELIKDFNDFSVWIYYTGYRAIAGKYFPEAINYPILSGTSTMKLTIGNQTERFNDLAKSITSKYLFIYYNTDTITIILNNNNFSANISNNTQNFTYSYEIGTKNTDNTFIKVGNVYVKFDSNQKNIWKSYYLLNNQGILNKEVVVYPNPCNIGSGKNLHFRLPKSNEKIIKLNIFSSDMRVISNPELSVQSFLDENMIDWNLKDFNGNTINSGIYFYSFNLDQKTYFGKFAVIR